MPGLGNDTTIIGNTSTAPELEVAAPITQTETAGPSVPQPIPVIPIEGRLDELLSPTRNQTNPNTTQVTVEDITNQPDSPNKGDTTLVQHPLLVTQVRCHDPCFRWVVDDAKFDVCVVYAYLAQRIDI